MKLLPPDSLTMDPTGAPSPDPRYMLTLRARHGQDPFTFKSKFTPMAAPHCPYPSTTMTTMTYKDAFEADVAMCDVEVMQVVDSVEQLLKHATHVQLGVSKLVGQNDSIIQVAALHVNHRSSGSRRNLGTAASPPP